MLLTISRSSICDVICKKIKRKRITTPDMRFSSFRLFLLVRTWFLSWQHLRFVVFSTSCSSVVCFFSKCVLPYVCKYRCECVYLISCIPPWRNADVIFFPSFSFSFMFRKVVWPELSNKNHSDQKEKRIRDICHICGDFTVCIRKSDWINSTVGCRTASFFLASKWVTLGSAQIEDEKWYIASHWELVSKPFTIDCVFIPAAWLTWFPVISLLWKCGVRCTIIISLRQIAFG